MGEIISKFFEISNLKDYIFSLTTTTQQILNTFLLICSFKYILFFKTNSNFNVKYRKSDTHLLFLKLTFEILKFKLYNNLFKQFLRINSFKISIYELSKYYYFLFLEIENKKCVQTSF